MQHLIIIRSYTYHVLLKQPSTGCASQQHHLIIGAFSTCVKAWNQKEDQQLQNYKILSLHFKIQYFFSFFHQVFSSQFYTRPAVVLCKLQADEPQQRALM